MSLLSDLVASGHIADIALAAMVLEVLLVLRFWGRGRLAAVLSSLAAGACLLLALRAALTGAGAVVIAALLAASLVAHLMDLYHRAQT